MGVFTPVLGAEFNPAGLYQPVQPPQPTETGDKVEVVELFWYGCPHCFSFLPIMESWETTKPDYIELRRMPAIFRDSWENHARAYYVAQQLNVVEAIHRPLFEAIHIDGRRMDTTAELAPFFQERAGVEQQTFTGTWDSFTVRSLLQKSRTMQRAYGVRGTPSVVINGKYVTSGSQAGSHDNVLKVIDALADMERKSTS